MRRKHVTLKLLWEEYKAEHPDDHYGLTQFRYHYNQNTVAKKDAPSTILSDMRTGGEKLFLDFCGDTMGYIDRETGEEVRCQAFVGTMPASDYGYLLFVPSQRTEDFVHAIIQCLRHLGGVSTNCCVYLGRDQHYYTVPCRHIGKRAHVAYTRTLVKIYVDGELAATHRRDCARGKYTIVEEHLASHSREYRTLSADRYVERADNALKELGDVVRYIFASSPMPPETHYKTCDGLLSLQRSADPDLFRTACQTALRYGRCNYRFIRSLVESKCIGVGQPRQSLLSPPEHGNIRGKGQFL